MKLFGLVLVPYHIYSPLRFSFSSKSIDWEWWLDNTGHQPQWSNWQGSEDWQLAQYPQRGNSGGPAATADDHQGGSDHQELAGTGQGLHLWAALWSRGASRTRLWVRLIEDSRLEICIIFFWPIQISFEKNNLVLVALGLWNWKVAALKSYILKGIAQGQKTRKPQSGYFKTCRTLFPSFF